MFFYPARMIIFKIIQLTKQVICFVKKKKKRKEKKERKKKRGGDASILLFNRILQWSHLETDFKV